MRQSLERIAHRSLPSSSADHACNPVKTRQRIHRQTFAPLRNGDYNASSPLREQTLRRMAHQRLSHVISELLWNVAARTQPFAGGHNYG